MVGVEGISQLCSDLGVEPDDIVVLVLRWAAAQRSEDTSGADGGKKWHGGAALMGNGEVTLSVTGRQGSLPCLSCCMLPAVSTALQLAPGC